MCDGLFVKHPQNAWAWQRGYDENHVAATWLRFQSFTAGRRIPDSAVTSATLPATLEREFKGLLLLVRWLNGAIGYR